MKQVTIYFYPKGILDKKSLINDWWQSQSLTTFLEWLNYSGELRVKLVAKEPNPKWKLSSFNAHWLLSIHTDYSHWKDYQPLDIFVWLPPQSVSPHCGTVRYADTDTGDQWYLPIILEEYEQRPNVWSFTVPIQFNLIWFNKHYHHHLKSSSSCEWQKGAAPSLTGYNALLSARLVPSHNPPKAATMGWCIIPSFFFL